MLSTANIVTKEPGVAKTFKPGNHMLKLIGITLQPDSMDKENEGWQHLILNLEGVNLTEQGFEGFFIDKDNPDLGRHKGQIGRVKADSYSFRSGINKKTGEPYDRDTKILEFFLNLGKAVGKTEELNAISADTIEEYVPKAEVVLCSDETFIYWCIGGREYEGKGGYLNYDMHLVRADYRRKKFAFSSKESDVVKFDSKNDKHFKAAEPKAAVEVDEFEPVAQDDFEV